jgi:hypothetical protein
MPFKKAEPKQSRLKIGFYGPQGSGKTLTALLVSEGLAAKAGKRVAFIDTEHGTDFYAKDIPDRTLHPKAFDFDAIYTRSLAETLEAVKSLDTNLYGAIVVDSISHLWDAAIAAYEGKQTSIGTIPMNAWGSIKKPFKELIRVLLDLPVHAFILGRQKNEFERDAKGELVKTGVAMRAEGETEYEPHICARFEPSYKVDGAQAGVTMIVEKDRSGILHGRTFQNPSFATFEPILPFLGDTQATTEDPEETAAKDSELLERDSEKQKAKSDKSQTIFTNFNSQIVSATSLEKLGLIATELKKQRKYLTPENREALLLVYGDKHKNLSAQVAPAEV